MSSPQIKPEAIYDSLYIGHKLSTFLDAFQEREIHLFSYFSSILSLYSGNTPDFWNYKYIPFECYPFSDDLDLVIKNQIRNGWFEKITDGLNCYYKLSAKGSGKLDDFNKLNIFKPRKKFLDASCTTSILIPYRDTIKALTRDPAISNATALESKTWLDQDFSSNRFTELSKAMGVPINDLTVTSLGWIQYLLIEKGMQ